MKRLATLALLALLVSACGSSSSTEHARNGPIALSGLPGLNEAQGLFLRDTNGSLRRLTTATNARDVYPSWSHDGKRIAFLRMSGDLASGTGRILVAKSDGSDEHQVGHVVAAAAQIGWSPGDDSLVFSGPKGGIWTVGADGTGSKQIYAEGLDATWSAGGRIVVSRPAHGLMSMNADGSDVRELVHPAQPPRALLPDSYLRPAWSPDGKRIAYVRRVWLPSKDLLYPTTIEIMNADGTGQKTLTKVFDESGTTFSWSPDGRSIAYTDLRDRGPGLWVIPSEGGTPRLLIDNGNYTSPSWGPAGT